MTTNTSIAPFFDDFNSDAGHHRILFKPSYAVQARELTQIQSIIQEQIRRFGNHVFQQGSIVIPGNSYIDDKSCYVKVESSYGGYPILPEMFRGKTIASSVSGVTAIIRKIVPATNTDPMTFYVHYTSGGSNGVNVFTDSENLFVVGNPALIVTTKTSAVGFGTLAFVNKGVYYINGFFVSVDNQSIVVSKYTNTASASIRLKINETIENSDTDETLLDPAQGSYNYAAPGADRLKIALELVSNPIDDVITSDYVEIMRVVNGVLQFHSRFPKYSELEKSLARRTSDETGDYVVSGFDLNIREHLKRGRNDGAYADGDSSKMVFEVDAGKAYISGFESESIYKSTFNVDKGRTVDHIKTTNSVTMRPSYGQYIFVSDIKRLPNFGAREVVELWDHNIDSHTLNITAASVTSNVATLTFGAQTLVPYLVGAKVVVSGMTPTNYNGTFIVTACNTTSVSYSLNGAIATGSVFGIVHNIFAVKVGETKVLGIDYLKGDIDSKNGIYALYVYDTAMIGAYKLSRHVGGVRFSNGVMTVLQKVSLPQAKDAFLVGETVTSWAFAAKVRLHDLVSGEAYLYRHDASKIMPPSGQTITGVTSTSSATISTVDSVVTVSTNNSAIFTIPTQNISEIRTSSNTINIKYTTWKNLTITTNSSGVGSASITQGSIADLEQSNVVATNSAGMVAFSLFSLNFAGTTLSIAGGPASSVIDVFVNVVNTGVQERAKSLTTFTQTGLSPAAVVALTKADIYDLVYVVSSTIGDITSRCTLDNGQRDYQYNLGSIGISGALPSGTLNVQYRYFAHSSGGDYFSSDSYKSSGLGLDYLGMIPTYRTQNDSTLISLKNQLDFRKIVTDSGDLLMPGTMISASVKYFIPRIDIITLNKSGKVIVTRGAPNDNPIAPITPVGDILLHTVNISAYTDSVGTVIKTAPNNKRFTMQDINVLSNRVGNLEYYSTLNSLEKDLVDMTVIDPITGLNRYKTGFLVDNFKNPNIISDTLSRAWRAEYDGQQIRPNKEQHMVEFEVVAGYSNYAQTGTIVSLPYVHKALVSQKKSTRVLNLNPYLVLSWEGMLTLVPAHDSWIETEYLPDIFNSVSDTVTVNREVIVKVARILPCIAPVVPTPVVVGPAQVVVGPFTGVQGNAPAPGPVYAVYNSPGFQPVAGVPFINAMGLVQTLDQAGINRISEAQIARNVVLTANGTTLREPVWISTPIAIPAPLVNAASVSETIRAQLAALANTVGTEEYKQSVLQAYLASTTYTPEQFNAAAPQYATADLAAVIAAAKAAV